MSGRYECLVYSFRFLTHTIKNSKEKKVSYTRTYFLFLQIKKNLYLYVEELIPKRIPAATSSGNLFPFVPQIFYARRVDRPSRRMALESPSCCMLYRDLYKHIQTMIWSHRISFSHALPKQRPSASYSAGRMCCCCNIHCELKTTSYRI